MDAEMPIIYLRRLFSRSEKRVPKFVPFDPGAYELTPEEIQKSLEMQEMVERGVLKVYKAPDPSKLSIAWRNLWRPLLSEVKYVFDNEAGPSDRPGERSGVRASSDKVPGDSDAEGK
jgi:hypothetical protein